VIDCQLEKGQQPQANSSPAETAASALRRLGPKGKKNEEKRLPEAADAARFEMLECADAHSPNQGRAIGKFSLDSLE